MSKILFSALILALGISTSARADNDIDQELKEYNQSVEKVQKDLANSSARNKMIDSKESREAADQVKSLVNGPAEEARLYEMASQVLGEMKGKDALSLQESLAHAQKDPKAFYKTLSPDMQNKIRELAGSIEARQKQKP